MPRRPNGDHGLNERQRAFADQYFVDFNAVAAYRRAGYKTTGASLHACASRLLSRPTVRAYLRQKQKQMSAALELKVEKVLRELQCIAFFDPRRLLTGDGNIRAVAEWDDHSAVAVQSFEVVEMYAGKGKQRKCIGVVKKLRLHPKVTALERLGQHLGLFKQLGDKDNPLRHEHHLVAADVLDLIKSAEPGIGKAPVCVNAKQR